MFKSPKRVCRSCFELSRQGQIGIRDQGAASISAGRGAGNQIEGRIRWPRRQGSCGRIALPAVRRPTRNCPMDNRGTLRHRCQKLSKIVAPVQVLEELSLLRIYSLVRLGFSTTSSVFAHLQPEIRSACNESVGAFQERPTFTHEIWHTARNCSSVSSVDEWVPVCWFEVK